MGERTERLELKTRGACVRRMTGRNQGDLGEGTCEGSIVLGADVREWEQARAGLGWQLGWIETQVGNTKDEEGWKGGKGG